MAIVFISPKRSQTVLISAIIGIVSLGLIIILLVVFLSKPQSIAPERVFKPKEVKINFDILKSQRLKELSLFPTEIKKEFNYIAETEDGIDRSGKILAVSESEAEILLEETGLENIEIKKTEIGRKNPFVPPQIATEE